MFVLLCLFVVNYITDHHGLVIACVPIYFTSVLVCTEAVTCALSLSLSLYIIHLNFSSLHAYVCTYAYIRTYARRYVHVCLRAYAHIHTDSRACVRACMHASHTRKACSLKRHTCTTTQQTHADNMTKHSEIE